MRKFSVCRWPGSRPGKAAKNDFLEFLKNAQHFLLSLDPRRHGKNVRNDFLEFLKNSQSFWLSLARQQARESCEK
ncbi:hypothetical protein T11_9131 [Trichinella zimbabwensis]|uniref:Uncharacterized protein n=1 Tax=Trichinella zimbabwensis TaxID=268475 RepID=A0A0V1FUW1_9BILA|nr:hypothetical protein T11_9131 [Trichinella zimbabwensis]